MTHNEIDTIQAYLTQDITYFKDGIEIKVYQNTLILVDASQGIALVGNDHITIDPDEFQALSI